MSPNQSGDKLADTILRPSVLVTLGLIGLVLGPLIAAGASGAALHDALAGVALSIGGGALVIAAALMARGR